MIEKNETYELVEKQPHMKAIEVKWIYKIKTKIQMVLFQSIKQDL